MWDTFPPLPPEAEKWAPDPDCIAKSGERADPRFNRNPFVEQREALYKKRFKTYSIPASATMSISTGIFSPSLPYEEATHTALAVRSTKATHEGTVVHGSLLSFTTI